MQQIDPTAALPSFWVAYIGFLAAWTCSLLIILVIVRGRVIIALLRSAGYYDLPTRMIIALSYALAFSFPIFWTLVNANPVTEQILVNEVMQQFAMYGAAAGSLCAGLGIWWLDEMFKE